MTEEISFHKQETIYTCGAAAMRMALGFCGVTKSEKQVKRYLGTNTVRGTWHESFPRVAERFLLDYTVKRNATLDDLRRLEREGYAVIVCYLYPPENVDHYAVVKRIDRTHIHFWDPWWGPEHKHPIKRFMGLWHSAHQWDNEPRWCIGVRRSGVRKGDREDARKRGRSRARR